MNKLILLVNSWMRLICNEKKIIRYASIKKEILPRNKEFVVAATQVKLRSLSSVKDYVEEVESYFIEANQQGASLLCFPELFGMYPIMLIPFVKNYFFNKTKKEGSSQIDDSKSVQLYNLLKYLNFYQVSTKLCCFFAKKYHIYVSTGSLYLCEANTVKNRQYLIDDQGVILGHQDKLHLVDLEVRLGIECGENLEVFHTPIGNIAIPICMDASYYETFMIAKKKGAEIICLPIANMEPYQYYYALRGIEPRIQEAGLYGIKSALVCNDGITEMSGKAGIFAPVELTAKKDGILIQSDDFYNRYTLCSKLDLSIISSCNNSFVQNKNERIHHQLMQLYLKKKREVSK